MTKPIAIDLFCGAGGMSEGLLQAGFHIVFSSDLNSDVKKTYTNRHEQLGLFDGINTHFEQEDITNLTGEFIYDTISKLEIYREMEPPKIDAVFGGPPCQGFSRAGKREKSDPRNRLFKQYIRVISEIKPDYVVMENVEGFLDTKLDDFIGVTGIEYPKESIVPDILKKEFEIIDYKTLEPMTLDASEFGVPQRRKRVIFIAYRNDSNLTVPEYPTPITTKDEDKVSVLDAIGDLIENEEIRIATNPDPSEYQLVSRGGRTLTVTGEVVQYDGQTHNHEKSNHSEVVMERFALYKVGETSAQVTKRLVNEGIDPLLFPNLIRDCKERLKVDQDDQLSLDLFNWCNLNEEVVDALVTKKNSRMRLHPDYVAPTMVTLPDDFIAPFENRILTVREMARLQSFDDSFVFKGKRTTGGQRRKEEVPQYSQVGNAVPPLLAKAIALEVKKAINQSRTKNKPSIV